VRRVATNRLPASEAAQQWILMYQKQSNKALQANMFDTPQVLQDDKPHFRLCHGRLAVCSSDRLHTSKARVALRVFVP